MFVVSLLFVIAGIWSLVNFFRLKNPRTALAFAFYVYVIILSIILSLAEIGWPKKIFALFGFLASPSGRAWFLFFLSPLALAAGFSRNRGAASNVVLIIAGFLGLALTPLALCFGHEHHHHSAGHVTEVNSTESVPVESTKGGTKGMFGRQKGVGHSHAPIGHHQAPIVHSQAPATPVQATNNIV
jgi:hypothetical protein